MVVGDLSGGHKLLQTQTQTLQARLRCALRALLNAHARVRAKLVFFSRPRTIGRDHERSATSYSRASEKAHSASPPGRRSNTRTSWTTHDTFFVAVRKRNQNQAGGEETLLLSTHTHDAVARRGGARAGRD